ncbi:MAG TPA: methylmalonyl Co-A mutase-associated GTPase MeaB [Chloroflexota bacterium]
MDLAERVLAGDRGALARALTVVERGDARGHDLLRRLAPRAGRAHVVGITGPPGVGKSTLVGAIARDLRRRGCTVGVLAVDPTSPLSGGALLGDRVRMDGLTGDAGVFVRSVASRGASGGLAATTADLVTVLEAAGHQVILVETVGVGQDEVRVAALAQTVVVVAVPGLGDAVQALKAGLFELADVLVVNKADRDGAAGVVADLSAHLDRLRPSGWRVPVLQTVATRGEGVPEVVDAVVAHGEHLRAVGLDRTRRREQLRQRLLDLVLDEVRRRAGGLLSEPWGLDLLDRVASGALDQHAAGAVLRRRLLERWEGDADPAAPETR